MTREKPCINRPFGCNGMAAGGDIRCAMCKKFGPYRLRVQTYE